MDDIDARGQIDAHVQRALARLPQSVRDDAVLAGKLRRIAIASDFAIDVLASRPEVLAALARDDGAQPFAPPVLAPEQRAEWPRLLRRHRRAESARLVWRDVLGLDDIDATLEATTRLAEDCLRIALEALEAEFAARHGTVRAADGSPVRLVVFGMGKLGGGELNFSSDVDLVYAYEQAGESNGARPLAAEEYFARLGRQLTVLLDETTADGFCHRVDLRLRPFGNAGRVAMSFAAMEQYFQHEGRDWERYAWQKARPVAGDLAAGERFLASLRPFVYRRYLDYGALDGLRAMKAMITAEVARRELADDIKRGPGGIREIEFLAQVLQLIRGGREPALRERRLLPALRALRDAGYIPAETESALADAYRFLRHVENRLQMLRDAQTHELPSLPLERVRLALGLGYDGADAMLRELGVHRARVAREFDALLSQRRRQAAADDGLAAYWRVLPDGGDAGTLAAAGFGEAGAVDAALRDFARSPSVRELSDASRARLDRVLPVMLQATASSPQPLQAVRRLLAMLHNILRRASYLALLDEEPAALSRLVDVTTRSAFLAERLAAHPVLLDELLDVRVAGPLPDREAFARACAGVLERDDTEDALFLLNEIRQQLSFRIALATLDRRQPAHDSTRQLAWLADAVVDVVRGLALRELRASHGDLPGARFAVVGYGSLGGEELGFGSDLDLVFLYDAPPEAHSDGARPLDAPRWFARLAQKIVGLLGAVTGGGRLYDVDVRLRPDGGKGLLVSSLASYGEYQRERAWTWEHQALVRARFVAGDASMREAFEAIRAGTLSRPRDEAGLRGDVAVMRQRMRGELDRGNDAMFDLKQGEGGLVDLEFIVQYLVLRHAAAHPALLGPRATRLLLDVLEAEGILDRDAASSLREAHAALLALGLDCTLDRRRRIVPHGDVPPAAREAIRAQWRRWLGG